MKDDEHQIQVTVEIRNRGGSFTARIPSGWQAIPALMPLNRAAKFSLQNCLESKALREWTTNPHAPSYVPHHD